MPSPWAGRQRRCQQSPEPLLGFSPVFLVNRGQKCWGSSPNPFFERVPGGANLVLLLPSCDGKGPAHVPKMRPFAGRAAVPCSPTALALPPLPPPLPPAPRSRLLASLLLLSPSPPAILCLRNSFTDPRRGARLWVQTFAANPNEKPPLPASLWQPGAELSPLASIPPCCRDCFFGGLGALNPRGWHRGGWRRRAGVCSTSLLQLSHWDQLSLLPLSARTRGLCPPSLPAGNLCLSQPPYSQQGSVKLALGGRGRRGDVGSG